MKYIARATNHPCEDLERNWSSVIGGLSNEDFHICESLEEAKVMWERYYGFDIYEHAHKINPFDSSDWGYHAEYGGYVQIHYRGLGGYELDAKNWEEAIREAEKKYSGDAWKMACVMDCGSGHFYAEDCSNIYKTKIEGLWIFEIQRGY